MHLQSIGEEIANSVSHGLGLLAALGAFPILILVTHERGGIIDIVAAGIFAASMVLLYTASTIYHALPHNRAKRLFQVLDHSAIYLLIAGTYTPFTLGVLRGAWGWTLFGLVWGLAAIGVAVKVVHGIRYPRLATWLYLAMGWLIVIAAQKAVTVMPLSGLVWLFAGGLAYTVGALIFMYAERIKYSHFVWHLFVLAGTTCHFIAVLYYAY